MTETSFAKNKMKIVLLEGIHSSAVEAFKADGYTGVEYFEKSMHEAQLVEAVRDTHLVGIRSVTQLTAKVFAGANRLIAVGCFCIGTNQVDLDAAQERGVPVFNAPFSNTRSVAELGAQLLGASYTEQTHSALLHAATDAQALTLLLTAPEFMRR